jgi:hypothetical protein
MAVEAAAASLSENNRDDVEKRITRTETAQHQAEAAKLKCESMLVEEKYRACAPFCTKEEAKAKVGKPARKYAK